MVRIDLKDFYNDGFGWICRHCEDQSEAAASVNRLLAEGESEGKIPRLSTRALARWADKEQRMLVCPVCGITELADKY
jgi:rubrerythrin